MPKRKSSMPPSSRRRTSLSSLKAITRLMICLVIAGLVCGTMVYSGVAVVTAVLIGWDVFSLLMIALCWIIFIGTPSEDTCNLASREDESRTIIFIIVLVSVVISLFGLLILRKATDHTISKVFHEVVSLMGVALSWFLLHSVFTLHYTHLFYGENSKDAKETVGGLNFPGEERPDYRDFAYFSFVIGMTFQVSDVNITSGRFRRLVLLHGIISFLYNTIIVALSISIISNPGN